MILGVDAGTSVIKAVGFSDSGKVLKAASRPTTLYAPNPGYSEQDLNETFQIVGEVIRGVTNSVREPVHAIGITGQGDGLWLMNERGLPIRNAITWLDARAGYIVQDWMESGLFEKLYRRNPSVTFPGAPAPLLAALSQQEPESLLRATTAGYCKDAIFHRLTGVRATDISDASEPFLDLETRQYAPDILRTYGLERLGHLLAPIEQPPGATHPLTAEGAALTGLPEGTPVHNGPFDLPATAIGAGVNNPGDGLIILGTTLACEVLVDKINTEGEPRGQTLCMLEPNRWLWAMPAMSGTATLDLMLSLLGVKHADLDELLSESIPGSNGVLMLPFLSPSGERAPFVDPAARGQISGLDLNTKREDIVRSVCEGIAFAARHCLREAGLSGDVSICGGGAESREWLKILASVLNRPVGIAPKPGPGARGAAIAAMIAAGWGFDQMEWTRPSGYVEPDAIAAGAYEDAFARYLHDIELAREQWHYPGRSRASLHLLVR